MEIRELTPRNGQDASKRKSGGRGDPWIVLAMIATIAIPAAVALNTVKVSRTLPFDPQGVEPTPYGYAISLLLFIVPIVVILTWFLRSDLEIPRRASLWTVGILVPLGCALDFFFARWFFVFPNAGATLGIPGPAIGGAVPIEEYVFYTTGFAAVLLIYLWLSEYWFAAYSAPDYPGEARKLRRLLRFHWSSALVGLVLICAAVLYKKTLSPQPQGFPGYFTFLVAGALVPSAGFFDAARPFINWRAFSLTAFLMLLVSLLRNELSRQYYPHAPAASLATGDC